MEPSKYEDIEADIMTAELEQDRRMRAAEMLATQYACETDEPEDEHI